MLDEKSRKFSDVLIITIFLQLLIASAISIFYSAFGWVVLVASINLVLTIYFSTKYLGT